MQNLTTGRKLSESDWKRLYRQNGQITTVVLSLNEPDKHVESHFLQADYAELSPLSAFFTPGGRAALKNHEASGQAKANTSAMLQ